MKEEFQVEAIAVGPGTVTWSKEESAHYEYEPQSDITVYELAVLTPYLSPRILGRDASRKAAVVPAIECIPGSTVGATVLKLGEWDVKDLGSSMRHLRKVKQL